MRRKTVDASIRYKEIKACIENGVYDPDNLGFWKKIFRISYSDNWFGIYKEVYVFNKRIYCNLVCRYVYK